MQDNESDHRTLRRLGARKAKTAQVPIIFDPMVSSSILEHIFEGINGDSVYRGASFLAGKLGQKIAGDNVNIIAIAQGSSELTIAIVVRREGLERAVRAVHRECGLGAAQGHAVL